MQYISLHIALIREIILTQNLFFFIYFSINYVELISHSDRNHKFFEYNSKSWLMGARHLFEVTTRFQHLTYCVYKIEGIQKEITNFLTLYTAI